MTRDRARELSNTDLFYCTKINIDGYNIETYNYRLVDYEDFVESNAFEMRGITFIEDGGIWHRFYSFPKFFNINENIGNDIKDLIDKEVINVREKADGSLIQFIQLPNHKIVAKTKASFSNTQTDLVEEFLINNYNYIDFIRCWLDINVTPLFELVSPLNQVVLNYNKTNLKLLALRDNISGSYINLYKNRDMISNYRISKVDDYKYSIDELIDMKVSQQNIEGWVVQFKDDKLVKVKTDWYFERHHLQTSVDNKNKVIIKVLDEEIDDVISQINNEEYKKIIEYTTRRTRHVYNRLVQDFKDLYFMYYIEYNEDRKLWGTNNHRHHLMKSVSRNLFCDEAELEEIAQKEIKDYMLFKTRRLELAKEFLNDFEK